MSQPCDDFERPMLSLLLPAVLFGLVYFPTLKYLSVGLVTPYA